MGLFGFLNKVADIIAYSIDESKSKDNKADNNLMLTESPLEIRRRYSIQLATDRIYQECFSKLIDQISSDYARNENNSTIFVNRETHTKLDQDTIYQVLNRASYDAISNVGLKTSDNPLVKIDLSYRYTVYISWDRR